MFLVGCLVGLIWILFNFVVGFDCLGSLVYRCDVGFGLVVNLYLVFYLVFVVSFAGLLCWACYWL